MEFPNTLPELCKFLRLLKGYTMADVAVRTGLSGVTISNIENGKNTSMKNVHKLAKCLGFNVEFTVNE